MSIVVELTWILTVSPMKILTNVIQGRVGLDVVDIYCIVLDHDLDSAY